MKTPIVYNPFEPTNCEISKVIGDPAKNRKCRFCGKTIKDGATFTNRSHAISEGLGNHSVFCLDECDQCNAKFSKLEQSIISFLNVSLCVYGIKGKPKKGKQDIRGIRTPLFDVNNSGDMMLFQFNTQNDNDVFVQLESNDKLEDFSISSEPKWNKYIPRDIFRSLSKYIVAIAKDEHLPTLQKTIQWINNGNEDVNDYNVMLFELPFVANSPKIIYFISNQSDFGNVKILGLFAIANIGFLYELPFTEERALLSKEIRKKALCDFCKNMCNGTAHSLDLNSDILQVIPVKFELSINDNMKINEDYFVIDSKEEIKRILKGNNF